MKTSLVSLSLVGIIGLLTFVVPITLWFVGDLVVPSRYSELAAGTFVILGALVCHINTRAFLLFPSSLLWKASCLIVGVVTLVLIFINILNEPVSRITGQARSPFSVISVIVLLPIAEELIFRGFMWSIFERLSTASRWRVVPLLGTSLMFGIGHLGYWMQSHWPLPPDAIFHTLSMMAAGICFGAFRWASSSLVVPIVVHIAANGAILLFQ